MLWHEQARSRHLQRVGDLQQDRESHLCMAARVLDALDDAE
jgi:hypothetical protein